jgi:hypothetical protein
MFKLILFLLTYISILSTESINNDMNVVDWTIGSLTPFNSSVKFGLHIFSPIKPGYYQVIVFLTGLDGLALGSFYDNFNSQLVNQSQSILVIFSGLEIIHMPDAEEMIFEKTLNWTIENLNGLFTSDKTPKIIKNFVFPEIKINGISLMGHSSGNHPLVSYMNKTCGIVKSKTN